MKPEDNKTETLTAVGSSVLPGHPDPIVDHGLNMYSMGYLEGKQDMINANLEAASRRSKRKVPGTVAS